MAGRGRFASGTRSSWTLWIVAAAIAVVAGLLHIYENSVYLQVLHKTPNRDFAAVAAMQTENAFYYSYFAEMVDASSATEALAGMIWDKRTEYPDTLNAIRRFNIYQEIIVGLEYRALRFLGLQLPHPYDFFRYHVLVLNGIGQSSLTLLAAEISGNPLAGIVCCLASFLNRFQISRLGNYTSSDLRELWGVPLLWIQVYYLWRVFLVSRRRHEAAGSYLLWFGFTATTFAFIVSWQFSPFMLLLQATAVYFVCIVGGYSSIRPQVVAVINCYILALFMAVAVHFGSPYLLTSPFFFQLAALKLSTSVFCCQQSRGPSSWGGWLRRRLGNVAEGLVALVGFVLVRQVLAPFATADTHVYEILCTKVGAVNEVLPAWMQLKQEQLPACAEPSFNAKMYLIMGVFKLIEWSSIQVYLDSTALQAAMVSCLLIILRCFSSTCFSSQSPKSKVEPEVTSSGGDPLQQSNTEGLRRRKDAQGASGSKAKAKVETSRNTSDSDGVDVDEADEAEEAGLLFFVVQFLLFFLLGSLINRLRVAFGPPMMVLAGTAAGPRLFPTQLQRRYPNMLQLVLFFASGMHLIWMTTMLPCVNDGEGICQHVSDKFTNDGDLVDLFDWVNEVVKPGTPVLASMNLAGTMRAFTHVPMTIHPQFESAELRKRVQRAYELYNCGSEASFAKTMTDLKAKLVIFEHSRCFFTPYNLDDKRKNCNANKHQNEDLMCIKLHGQSRRFKLVFMNGNYAVFQLRKTPLPLQEGEREPKAPEIRRRLEDPDNWKDYVHECERTQREKCAPRLMEAAAHFYHGMKRHKSAEILRDWAQKISPENGYVNFYMARYHDVDENQPQKAKRFYDKALKLLPNNIKVLTEVILFYDVVLQDPHFSAQLIEKRSKKNKDGSDKEVSLLELNGPGIGLLMCEAAAAAKNAGNEKLASKLWKRARKRAPLSDCIKNNWPIINQEPSQDQSSYGKHYSMWDKVKIVLNGGLNLELGPHHQSNARFLGSEPFVVWPPKNKTTW